MNLLLVTFIKGYRIHLDFGALSLASSAWTSRPVNYYDYEWTPFIFHTDLQCFQALSLLVQKQFIWHWHSPVGELSCRRTTSPFFDCAAVLPNFG